MSGGREFVNSLATYDASFCFHLLILCFINYYIMTVLTFERYLRFEKQSLVERGSYHPRMKHFLAKTWDVFVAVC